MKISKPKYFIIILALSSFILLYYVFTMIEHLSSQKYIVECFTDGPIQESTTGETSHTVNLPLTTTYSCTNYCGPTAKCAVTGEQCFTDVDCKGCQPDTPSQKKKPEYIDGNDDAGKLTVGVTPTYSSLTAGFGTKERIVTKDMYSRPSQANFGIDTWGNAFNEGQTLFNKRYKSHQLKFMPKYPQMYTMTGEFITDGPLPSNY